MACSNEMEVLPILDNVALFEFTFRGERSRETLFILGSTGSGKTTITNILANNPIQIVNKKGTDRIDVVNEYYAGWTAGPVYETVKIVHGGDSGTCFLGNTLYDDVEIWDYPVDLDTRTTKDEIINKYFVHKIMSVAVKKGGVKLIVLQEHYSCEVERGSAFKNSIRALCDIFEPKLPDDFARLIDATTFVFNKVPEGEMNSDNPMEYIECRLELVGTKISRNKDIEYPEWATAAFISLMKKFPFQVRHVEIPKAQKGFEDFVRRSVLDPDHGVWAKVSSTCSLKNFPPRLAVSDDKAAILVLKVNAKCQLSLKENCETLKELLRSVLASDVWPFNIADLLKKLRNVKSSLDSGGASRVSLELFRFLKELGGPEKYHRTLREMETTIERMQFFNSILRNSQAGSDFTVIVDAVKHAAGESFDASEKEEIEKYSAAYAEYIEKQNNLSSFKKILAENDIVVSWLLNVFLAPGLNDDSFSEIGDAFSKMAFGNFQEPSTAKMNQSKNAKII